MEAHQLDWLWFLVSNVMK